MMSRPKEKEIEALGQQLLVQGPDSLSTVELLGLAMKSPSLARALVRASPDWANLSRDELGKIPRLSKERIAQVMALAELAKRLVGKPLVPGQAIRCSEDVVSIYRPRLASHEQEVFLALGLNTRHCLIAEHIVAKGTANSVEVHPRDVFRALIRDGAVKTIAIHNHPSGDPKPSENDLSVCRRLREAGILVGVELMDFIIVSSQGSASFRDLGLMSQS